MELFLKIVKTCCAPSNSGFIQCYNEATENHNNNAVFM